MPEQAKRRQLAEFLRSRRARLSPEAVGLYPGTRRRTPGLRREEVALLANVSTSWYTWLEQARDVSPSPQILDAIADGLRLGPDERAHLFALAGQPAAAPPHSEPQPHAALPTLVYTLDPHPSYVIDRAWNVVAYNRAEAGLECEFDELPAEQRNLMWITFTDPVVRAIRTDWENEAKLLLGQLRSAVADQPDDARLTDLIARLTQASGEFRTWWDRHDVTSFVPARKRIEHHTVGTLVLDYVKLRIVNDTSHTLVTYLPADETTAQRLPRLAELSAATRS